MNIHYNMKHGMLPMYEGENGDASTHSRFVVLALLGTYADANHRAYPSISTIRKKTGLSNAVVSGAIDWLFKHGAIYNVPPQQRTDVQLEHLPDDKYVFQLTGVFRVGDKWYQYLVFDEEAFEKAKADFYLRQGKPEYGVDPRNKRGLRSAADPDEDSVDSTLPDKNEGLGSSFSELPDENFHDGSSFSELPLREGGSSFSEPKDIPVFEDVPIINTIKESGKNFAGVPGKKKTSNYYDPLAQSGLSLGSLMQQDTDVPVTSTGAEYSMLAMKIREVFPDFVFNKTNLKKLATKVKVSGDTSETIYPSPDELYRTNDMFQGFVMTRLEQFRVMKRSQREGANYRIDLGGIINNISNYAKVNEKSPEWSGWLAWEVRELRNKGIIKSQNSVTLITDRPDYVDEDPYGILAAVRAELEAMEKEKNDEQES